MTENTNCKNHNKKNLRNILIVVILVVLISILGYLFLHNKANNTNPKNSAKSINDTLRKQKSTLNQKDSVVNIDEIMKMFLTRDIGIVMSNYLVSMRYDETRYKEGKKYFFNVDLPKIKMICMLFVFC